MSLFFWRSFDANNSGTIHLNYLKFGVAIDLLFYIPWYIEKKFHQVFVSDLRKRNKDLECREQRMKSVVQDIKGDKKCLKVRQKLGTRKNLKIIKN